METRYDILIVGSEISGLISAAVLVQKGYRVAIISSEDISGSYEKGGYRFNKRPVMATGLDGGPLGRIFHEAEIPNVGEIKKSISYQVVLPDERVDICKEPALFYEELRRCFRQEIDKVAEFYKYISVQSGEIRPLMDMDPFSFRFITPSAARKGKRPIKDVIEGLGLSRRFESFIAAQIASFSSLHAPASVMAASSVLESCRNGFYFLEGGTDMIRKVLLNRFRVLKGDLVKSPAIKISRTGKRWLLRTESEALSGKAVIGNTNPFVFCGLFLDGHRGYLKKAERVEKALHSLTINLGVKDNGVPVGMAESVVMLRDYSKDAVIGNLIFAQMGPSVNGKKSISFTCQIPKNDCGKEKIKDISENLLEGVDRLCPFIERHTEVLDLNYPALNGEGKYVTSLKHKMGIGVLPHKISEGIFYAGPEVFPALGFDGLVYSAEMAASAAVKEMEKGRA